jgi:Cof subfamily protein (haloacid dehalogenase superfamily)
LAYANVEPSAPVAPVSTGRWKAVVTDLDGTIIRRDGTLSALTIGAAAELERRGIPLVVATARTPHGVSTVAGLQSVLEAAVCCNGALGWSPKPRRTLWRHDLAPGAVKQIVEVLSSNFTSIGLAAYTGEQWVMNPSYDALRPSTARRGDFAIVSPEELLHEPICAMAVCSPDRSPMVLASMIRSRIDGSDITLTMSDYEVLDIAPAQVDKATGVREALDGLGILAAETISFGDMPNDLPMLRDAGLSVAMGNGHPDVIAAADVLTTSVEHDGFAESLRNLGIIS